MNRIGIMQGRLSPPVGGQIQAFPADWRAEFPAAQRASIDVIEWLYREPLDAVPNPLDATTTLAEIRTLERETGVRVRSICADYFVDHPLIVGERVLWERAARLVELLHRAATLTVVYVVLPFVGRVPGADDGAPHPDPNGSRLRTVGDQDALMMLLSWLRPTLAALDLRLCFESDWPAKRLRTVLALQAHDPHVRVCYDTGDRAALGYDPASDLGILGASVGAVHVKDRQPQGPTVPLGQGAADFPAVARALQAIGYAGTLVLQTARSAPGQEVDLARAQRDWVTRCWTETLAVSA